jgi:hypothetical protein
LAASAVVSAQHTSVEMVVVDGAALGNVVSVGHSM